MTVADYPDFQTPQAHATAIYGTGVPLYAKPVNLASEVLEVITAGENLELGPFTIGGIGYEMSITILSNSLSTSPFLGVTFTWSDSATGLVTGMETWWLGGSSTSPGQTFYGTGPSKGDTLNVQLANGDSLDSVTVTFGVTANSRAYVRDDWRQQTYNPVPSFTLGNADQSANFLLQTAPTVGAATPSIRLMPLYAGIVRMWTSAAGKYDITISALDRAISLAPAGNQIFEDAVTAAGGGFLTDTFTLPRCQCLMTLTNNSGASMSIGATVIIAEQLP